jgi:hypothetical protein
MTNPNLIKATSPALDKIVEGFRLRICEVIENQNMKVLRFDFVADSDDGRPLVCGATQIGFLAEDDPRDFAEKLRGCADMLDNYWARAFPSAVAESPNGKAPNEYNLIAKVGGDKDSTDLLRLAPGLEVPTGWELVNTMDGCPVYQEDGRLVGRYMGLRRYKP